MGDDVERFRAVMAIAVEHRLVLSVIRVGDIVLHVAGRLPDRQEPKPVGRQEVMSKEDAEREQKLVELRKRSKEVFGVVKPDEVLLAMEGAL
jgi:hypothetical protein